ncbi:MAG: xanthine dehydrogenase family protein molybdopterin-binding subunit [Dehalococcoidia bacterium]
MVTSYQVIGKAIPRIDGADKVTGEAMYAADFTAPGMLWGKSLRSPFPHARIVSIDTSAARALPGVHAVITGADYPNNFYGRTIRDVPVLARDVVRYHGERVAAVVADDEDIAQQALDLIEVEYEELPAVFDPIEAGSPDAPIIHPNFNSYAGIRAPLEAPSNVYVKSKFERGDIDKAFAEADHVFEHTYRTQAQHAGYMEPQAILAWADHPDGGSHIWVCTKAPYRIKEAVATSVGIAEPDLTIHGVFVGGDFGAKSSPPSAPIALLLSQVTGKPVMIVHDYVDELLSGNPNQSMVYVLKTGVMNDGTIVAHSVDHYANSGAYAGYKPGGAMGGANQAAGPYKVENVRVTSQNAYTNTLPGQIYRAPGEPQAFFALESHIDEIAKALGRDPVEFRLQNLVETGEEMAAGEALEDVKVKEVLRAAVEAAGYYEPKGPNIGRGLAIGDRGQGGGQSSVHLTLRPDGSLLIRSPLFDQGSGSATLILQAICEEFGVNFDAELEIVGTESGMFDAGLAGSIQSRLSSTTGYEGAQELKRAVISFVAQKLDASEDSLLLQGEEILRTDLEERVNWRDLIRESGEEVTAMAKINENVRPHFTSFVCQVAEVHVDPETGEIRLLKMTTAHDVGQVLNAVGHQGQINGGVVQGMGFALMEDLQYQDGQVVTASFGDYKIPTIQDIPELKTVLLTTDHGSGPYHVKGIGEAPMIPVAGAIANAIADASGARIRDLPATAEKVYDALRG